MELPCYLSFDPQGLRAVEGMTGVRPDKAEAQIRKWSQAPAGVGEDVTASVQNDEKCSGKMLFSSQHAACRKRF